MENINKDPKYWIDNFNLIGIARQFNADFKEHYNRDFYGEINVIIYDRNRSEVLKKLLDFKKFLNGFVPVEDEKSNYDFILTVDKLYPFKFLAEDLFPMYHEIVLLNIVLQRNNLPNRDEIVVLLQKSY